MKRRLCHYSLLFFAVTVLVPATALASSTGAGRTYSGPLRIYGNETTKTYIIEREIPFSPGDPFDLARFNAARRRIANLPGIDYVDMHAFYTGPDSTLAITVFVTEKPAIEGKFRFERGYQDKMSWGVTMVHSNFRGRNEKLRGSFLLRGNQVYEGSWENPWVGTHHRIGVGLKGYYHDYRYVYADAGPSLSDAPIQCFGGELVLFLSRGGTSRVFTTVGFESVDGGVAGVTLEPGGDQYATVSAGFVADSRDSARYPWRGVYLEAIAREIGPGQDAFNIFEGTVDARAFLPVLGRTVVAAHSRLAWRDGDRIPIYRRDHIGGAETLRGYDYGSFHGTNSLVGGVEYRIPLNFSRSDPMEHLLLGLGLHLFADAAAAWENRESLDGDLFHTGYGAGLSFLNRNVPGLRFDFGWHDGSDMHFEFAVGMKF